MRTYTGGARDSRTLAHLLADAIERLVQDASEYVFIGFVGATAACIGTLMLLLMHTLPATALVAPWVLLVAAGTLSVSTVAFCRALDSQQPEAGRSSLLVLMRAPAFLRPWLPLSLGLGALTILAGVV